MVPQPSTESKAESISYPARPFKASKLFSKVDFLEWSRQGLVRSLVQRLVRVLHGLWIDFRK